MMTKEQERAALNKIEKILGTLDEGDSYVRKAFEGCVEDAKKNIEDDAWDSFCSRYDSACRKIEGLNVQLLEKNKALRERSDMIATLNQDKDKRDALILKEEEKLEKANDLAYARLCEINKKDSKIAELELEIIKLKAKLYDMANTD